MLRSKSVKTYLISRIASCRQKKKKEVRIEDETSSLANISPSICLSVVMFQVCSNYELFICLFVQFVYNLEMTVGLTSAAGNSWILVLGFVQCGEDLKLIEK